MPDMVIDKHGSYLNSNVFAIYQHTDEVYLMQNIAANAVVINANKLTIKFRSSDFHIRVSPGFWVSGYVEANFNTVDIGSGIGFKTQTGSDSRQLMAVDSASIIVDIEKDDITLYIGGGAVTDLAGVIKPIIKGKVLD